MINEKGSPLRQIYFQLLHKELLVTVFLVLARSSVLPYTVRKQERVEAMWSLENCPVCVYALLLVGSIVGDRHTFNGETPQTQKHEFCNAEGEPDTFSTRDVFNTQVVLQS